MALMDYKFNRVVRDGSTTKAFLTFFTGGITTAAEGDPAHPNTETVTRYRSEARVSIWTLERDGTLTDEQMVPFLNTELAARAAALGHTPVDEQTNE